MRLSDYVLQYAARGACTCGNCCDSADNPEEHQPSGHTIDLTFFKVAKKDGATKERFLELVRNEFPGWLDAREHSYLECGADIGDQGICLMAFGLGHLLGAWSCLSPEIIPALPDALKQQMAGMGMISIRATPTN